MDRDPALVFSAKGTSKRKKASMGYRTNQASTRRSGSPNGGLFNSYTMSKKAAENHKPAATHHTKGAKQHTKAAKYHEAGYHEKAVRHAHTVDGHTSQATEHTTHARQHHAAEHNTK